MAGTAHLVAAATLLLLPPAAAHAAPAGADPPSPVEVDPAIVGGQEATTCQWPTAVALVSSIGLCTGTLVHPRVVIYAAHCGTDFTEVAFGETMSGSVRAPVERCDRRTAADEVGPSDYAFCILAQPMEDIPLTPVAYGCEGNQLTAGHEVAIAGFGEDADEQFGVKRWAMTTIAGYDMGMVLIGGGGTGAWRGDSGGPVYARFADGGWRSFGIVSGGPGPGQSVYYVTMGNVVPWVEEQSGIDITPCHSSDGTWQPTPACGGYATEPTGGGSWTDQCSAGDPLSAPSTTCGGPFAPEENAPEVRILSPDDGTVIDQFPAEVTVQIEAVDDTAVRAVRLAVDGEVMQERLTEPWQFTGTFPQGTYDLVAVAEDVSGNDAQSDTTVLYVGEEPGGCGACAAGAGGAGGGDLLLAAAVLFLLGRLLRRQREGRAGRDLAG